MYKNTNTFSLDSTKSIEFSPFIIGTMLLGKWGQNFSATEVERFIRGCLDLGLNCFDHADIYGHYTTEALFGKVLKKDTELRSKMQLISKCGIKLVSENRPEYKIKSYDSSKEHIIQSVDQSLLHLGTDYLDVLLIHRPDFLMDPEEIQGAVEELKKEGKILAFGVSNFTPSQVDLLQTKTPLVTNQIEISLLHLEAFFDGTLDQCMKLGIRPMAWSPLGGGALFKQSDDTRIQRINVVLEGLEDKYDATKDQLLLGWLRKHPAGIIPVLGTTKLERIQSALGALNVHFEREDWYRLPQASRGEEVK